ncbi:MAG: bifunctional hydroxymethylpyrimidine kinase/phosphomethylpyrimidine kinase [Bauldia sp.]|uniref:bifunctional hydroxymethylpyrimidine kinase/phosphomethylpyrimidine kinase n=1 Tax=Bauldia sp. TaxID=2575872 RepID=UPI001DDD5C2E|nr:bifunctional hydroxymethylpyrimidine kinase/phosphomethylpyrimidine kinase [Bauldia sp.]MCB1496346.1 bifunctional hydroxymethylpyrimidine kinase/phosphomethylpyrimidine kinase [Bauldia sp.]
MSKAERKQSVIVISSEVARGSVGGRAGTFVLQRMGFPVWWAPTVALPWHPGHGPAARMTPSHENFKAFLGDLATAPWLGEVGAVMSGYLGDSRQAAPIARLVDAVRAKNPDAIYLCDPIIGDAKGLFQPAEIAAAIRDDLLPRADIATPNRFELGWLSDKALKDNEEIADAGRALGVLETIVTSAPAGEGRIGSLLVEPKMASLFSHIAYPSVPHGTGDLLAALYLGNRLGGKLPEPALTRSLSATEALIRLGRAMGADEMPLVAGQALFETPPGGSVTVETAGRPT